MLRKLTDADQLNLVGDGLAVGCLDLGVTAITTNTQTLDQSFRHAWRNFPLAAKAFPHVKASLARCDIQRILRDSPRRKGARVEWHQSTVWWEPHLRASYDDIDEVAESIADLDGIPRDQWLQLARPFVDKLGDECIRRGG
ncbi:hypothetical protein [Micromonospora sp. WMMD737]|uniref:hypothetical protein n=1 Tax=Micromonospora sp. WMMD737 TaxID=3404113 RepID=UPI003B9492A3